MATVRDILAILDEYEKDPESYGIQLRLNLAEIVIRQLDARGWTQRDLAERAGLKEPYVSRVIHSDANCTLESAGRLLHALGVEAALKETENVEMTTEPGLPLRLVLDTSYDEEIDQEVATTGEEGFGVTKAWANGIGSVQDDLGNESRVAYRMG